MEVKKEKNNNSYRKALGKFCFLQSGPWPGKMNREGGAGQNPAMWVVGGDKGEVRELEGTTAHLKRVLDGRRWTAAAARRVPAAGGKLR